MKCKKFSKEWFENKLIQYRKMQPGYKFKLTHTKGYKPDITSESIRDQKIKSLYKLAKEKHIDLA